MGEGSTNELYKLDLSSHTWSQVAGKGTLPEPRSFHAMVSVKGKLYVFGGCGTSGRLSDLHSFDCESGTWAQLRSSEAIKVWESPALHICSAASPREASSDCSLTKQGHSCSLFACMMQL